MEWWKILLIVWAGLNIITMILSFIIYKTRKDKPDDYDD